MMPKPMPLSVETQFVFRSADPACGAEELLSLAKQVRDWPRALTLAEMEGATPAIWRLVQPRRTELPREIAEFLRMRAMVSEFRMTLLSQRAQETVRAFATAGIPVLLLKGAAIGAMTDPTFRSRPMGDVDLLIHPEDAERATAALFACGWSVTSDPVVVELLQGQHHLPHFVRADLPGLRLELHTMLLPPDHTFELDVASWWREAVPAPAPFEGAMMLSPEHHLLHACIHFAWQHGLHFGPWRTVRSIAALTGGVAGSGPAGAGAVAGFGAGAGFSWEKVEREARAAKAGTTVYWTLRLTQLLIGERIPAETLARLAPPNPAWVMRALERHFVATLLQGEGPRSPSVRMNRRLWLIALRPRWSGLRAAGREDREHRWDRAYGRENRESRVQRLARHLSGYRTWWAFVRHTLIGI